MPELINGSALFDLFKAGVKYKIIKIIGKDEDTYAYGMKFFIMKEEEMNQAKEIEEVMEADNIIPFEQVRLKMGGKQPPSGIDWLSDLKKGTHFLVYMKGNTTSLLGDFILGTDPKMMKPVYLGYEGPGGFNWKFHDPVKFSNEFGLYAILEEDNGNGSEVPEGTVEGDGKP